MQISARFLFREHQSPVFHAATNRMLHRFDVAWFDEVIVSAFLQGSDGRLDRSKSGEHYRNRQRRLLPDPVQNGNAVPAFHVQVSEYQIVIAFAEEIDGFVTARRRVNDVAFPFENCCGGDAQALFVIDDEQACFLGKWIEGACIMQRRVVPRLVK